MASETPSYRLAFALTDAAGRDDNEDACAVFRVGANDVVVIADGAGGHAGGGTASATMIAAATKFFESADSDRRPLDHALEAALDSGHRAVLDVAKTSVKFRDMRTTALVVIGTTTEAWVGHVGDSRAYLVRDGVATRLTRDDRLVQTLVDLGELDEEAAKKHSKAHVLTQSIGDPKPLEYHVHGPIEVRSGDRIIACSDGFWEVVPDAKLGQMASTGAPSDVAKRLVAHAIESHADDNVTVGVIAWMVPGARPVTAKSHVSGRGSAKSRRQAQQRMNIVVLIGLLLVVAAAALIRWQRDHRRPAFVPPQTQLH